MQVDQLYRQFDLQRTAITHDIHVHDQYVEPPAPGFTRTLSALSGWLLGLTCALFIATLLVQLHGSDMNKLMPACFGIGLSFVVLGWSVRPLRAPDCVADSLVIGGLVFMLLAFGVHFSGRAIPSVALTLAILLLSVRFGATLLMQGLVASILAGLIGLAIFQELAVFRPINFTTLAFALQSAVGVLLFTFPSRIDLRPLAGVALVSAVLSPVIGHVFFDVMPEGPPAVLAGQLVNFVSVFLILTTAWFGAGRANQRIEVIVLATLCLPAMLILPQAGSSALIVLLLAWCRGSQPIAVIGFTLQLAFIIQYFYDQSPSLLGRIPTMFEKSLIVGGIGLALMAISGTIVLLKPAPDVRL